MTITHTLCAKACLVDVGYVAAGVVVASSVLLHPFTSSYAVSARLPQSRSEMGTPAGGVRGRAFSSFLVRPR
eukprot:547161-Prorocentrum_minimum.AAC.1